MVYFLLDLIVLGTITGIMMVGLNLQYGMTGMINFTYYTFVAIGAYMTAVTMMGPPPPGFNSGPLAEQYILQWTLPWPIAILIGGVSAALLGLVVVLVTVRRLRSDYLAIVTIAVGYIIFTLTNNYIPLFNGANGLFGVPQIANLKSEPYAVLLTIISLVALAACIFVSSRIFHSPAGRVLRTIREDIIVARTFGKNVQLAQVVIFVISSFMAGIAGGLLVVYVTAWSPLAFTPTESFLLIAALVIGGTGNYWGALLGSFVVLEGLAEFTRFLPTSIAATAAGPLRAILIGVGLILFLRFRPQGILPESLLRMYKKRTAVPPAPISAGDIPGDASSDAPAAEPS
ncbi:MAG TPA: branched-chain amino acid ABC transporter permease [Ktedonobacterales bacterium]|nr:branched-chain amino acid ABC transporter permease [Ktedonobacterales bacterium]